ncbi:hypothetical protein [Sphaerimonospora thailandensis]|uniref:Uncharacterized protein n=1 Tax=Sphaerimonospora thailandensis TaxID=795644 RepID=A0A8J3RD31_9ACTN|nr:hypothetical protein [Sphaerimonospora thailandensis]GIH72524.1 hypothetical protein Mth01_47770 [Sphaerimonospora thailandensis]
MANDESELKSRLEEVDAQIARLHREAVQMREEIGQSWDAPTDPAERAVLLTNVEQQEALIGNLQNRREQILRRLRTT